MRNWVLQELNIVPRKVFSKAYFVFRKVKLRNTKYEIQKRINLDSYNFRITDLNDAPPQIFPAEGI